MCAHPTHRVVPFQSANEGQVLGLVLSGMRPVIPASVPGPVASVVERCWVQDPGGRPSFSDLVAVLDSLLSELSADGPLCDAEE